MPSSFDREPENTPNSKSEIDSSAHQESRRKGAWYWWKRILLLLFFLVLIGLGYYFFGRHLTLKELAAREAELRDFGRSYPVAAFGIAFLLYAAVTGLSLPGAIPLTLSYGWYFGFWSALILVSFASTTGATLAFLFSRYLFRDWVQSRFGDRLEKFNRRWEEEGPFYLFTLRMVPAVPFFVINLAMGLTPISVWTYWWVSQVGMLPGTAVYVYAGHAVPTLQELTRKGPGDILTAELIVAFILLGLFPLAVKKLVPWIRRKLTKKNDKL